LVLEKVKQTFKDFYGECTPYSSSLTSDYVKVQVNFKGSNLFLDYYDFGIWDYASHPGCFHNSDDGIAMVNYIKIPNDQKMFPFEFSLRSVGVLNNSFEYSATISDKDGKKVLGKFPSKDETLKGKIQFLKYPVVIKDTIQIKM
jgi:hypothetical protein